jgi:hypothetical protein
MTGNEIVTLIGKKVCEAAYGASATLGQPYVCSPQEYFNTGAAMMGLWTLFAVVALFEVRRRNRRADAYR